MQTGQPRVSGDNSTVKLTASLQSSPTCAGAVTLAVRPNQPHRPALYQGHSRLSRVSDFPSVVMRPAVQAERGLDRVYVHKRDPGSGFPVPACLALHHVPRDGYMGTPEDVTCPECLRGHVVIRLASARP